MNGRDISELKSCDIIHFKSGGSIPNIKQRIQETFGKTIAMNNFEYEDIIPGEEVTGEYSVNHGIMKVSGYKMIGCMEEISYMYSGGIWNDLRYRP